ncbi:carnitine acetyltransferase [Scheffersomyces xylosifermentans]|uniref:carnitine acetyltransferase n=1 Tax=Scheffersomyces xylosifermentans TaxID=1304137 RepID=UPI00315C6EE3
MSYYTYENEDSLPRLSVPPLAATTQQLLAALKPLMSYEEYNELLIEASDFVSNDLINLIQQHLIAASENPTQTCYWNTINNESAPAIYGELRGDILPRNPYLILEEDPYSKTLNPPNQAQRAANLINSSLKFIISLRNETLKPDYTPKNNNPLTMKCYLNLFGTTRIPASLDDDHNHHVSIKKYKNINDSRHIVIICNNQYYSLEVITPFTEQEYEETKSKHKIWFSDHELSLILQNIIDVSEKVDHIESINNSIGTVTTQSLKHWKLARIELGRNNPETLELIDNALFVLVLDGNSPANDQEKTAVICHGSSELSEQNVQIGSCTSRWYDKLQLIVTKNSVAGIVWESTSMDSTAILRFISDIFTDSVLKLAKNINGSEYTLFDNKITFVSSNGNNIKPEKSKIIFKKTPELQNLIHLSETRLADLINQHEYRTLNVKLDSHLITKFNLSVDSILQICFQITNYTLYGRMANTLEPITTRKFRDSRTELVAVQNDSISNLVKLYITNASPSDKWESFKRCSELHTKQYKEAMVGKGFERHFMSLIQVIKNPNSVKKLNQLNTKLEPLPEMAKMNLDIPLLCNPIIEKLVSPELLISNCGNPALSLFGIPPAIDQGYGIGYIIHTDKVLITVCSKYRQTDRFLDTFNRVIMDMKNMLKQRSNFLLDINDSESRKAELQRLRIEHELKNIELDLPSKKHPIPLTIDSYETIPYDNVVIHADSRSHSRSDSIESDSGNDFDLLGGYAYFDFGELDSRSDELSRNESILNSHSNLSSTLNSRHHSATNLHKLSMAHAFATNDLKEKLSISERIRDKISHSEDTLPSPDIKKEGSVSAEDSAEGPTAIDIKSRSTIGRQLDISKFD